MLASMAIFKHPPEVETEIMCGQRLMIISYLISICFWACPIPFIKI
jgi:hypothetical protein